MGDRYYLWVGARLVVAVALVAWAASYLGSGSGEKEFQKTLDAMKQVHSFRVVYSSNAGNQRNDMLWEVDCNRDLLHHHWHAVAPDTNPPTDMHQDQTFVGTKEFDRKPDGTWQPSRYTLGNGSARWYCTQLAQGLDSNVLPQIATMIRRGIIQKGDKKIVNGVRCREWLVTLKGGTTGLEHDTVCLGLDDHLPYEMTVDYTQSHSTFADYNAPIPIDMPEPAVQPASANTGSESN